MSMVNSIVKGVYGHIFEKKVSDECFTKCVKLAQKMQKLLQKEGFSYVNFILMDKKVKREKQEYKPDNFVSFDLKDINGNTIAAFSLHND